MERKSLFQLAQLKHLYSTSNAAIVLSTLIAGLLVIMQRHVISISTLNYWFTLVVIVAVFRVALIQKYKKTNADDNSTFHFQLTIFRLGVLAAGLVWGSAGVFLFPINDTQQQLFLIFMLAGLSAGGVITYSVDLVSAVTYSVSVVLPTLVHLMLLQNEFSLAMGFSGTLYLGFMIVSSRQNYLNLQENIKLRLDATEREKVLRVRNEWHQAILDGTMDGYWLVDMDSRILEVNDTYCQMSGYSSQELLTMRISDLEAEESIQKTATHIQKIIETGEDYFESKHRRKDGSYFEVEISAQYRFIEGGQFVIFLHDITERKKAEDEIQSLAYFDPLTRLPNRRMLIDHIKRAMAARMRTGKDGAILFLDLDHFKTLNDTLGHAIGDMFLQQVAERLTACLRENDTIAHLGRLGGDEFVVMLEELSSHPVEAATQARIVGEKILSYLVRPYQLATHEYKGTVSIGVALFSDHDSTKEDMLKHADIAMYQAKKGGRNGVCFFDPVMQVAINSRSNLQRELSYALEQDQFLFHYQTQVDSEGHALGAEALIRWINPTDGIVTPFHFIPLAEETGLILQIGNWVVNKACEQLKSWQLNPATQHLTLSINVSAKQFHQANFVTQVNSALKKYDVNPNFLKLELTESILLENIEETIKTMIYLGDIGIRFSLDDFGTGYSSLQYLKRLPLYQLKIDQSFTRDIVVDNSDKAIVQTIIAMANSLNLEVIAEGVETEEQRKCLTEFGCKKFQGYLFGEPMPLDQFESAL